MQISRTVAVKILSQKSRSLMAFYFEHVASLVGSENHTCNLASTAKVEKKIMHNEEKKVWNNSKKQIIIHNKRKARALIGQYLKPQLHVLTLFI